MPSQPSGQAFLNTSPPVVSIEYDDEPAFAELMRLSRTSIADEMREEHVGSASE
jgi:hypothetical protein